MRAEKTDCAVQLHLQCLPLGSSRQYHAPVLLANQQQTFGIVIVIALETKYYTVCNTEKEKTL